MDDSSLRQWAERFVRGELPANDFLEQIRVEQVAETQHATVDLDRANRCGYPEVIYASGKSNEDLLQIVERLLAANQPVLATRASQEQADFVQKSIPRLQYNPLGRTLRVAPEGYQPPESNGQLVAIVTAGTSDLAIAEEARETIDWMGQPTVMIHDVGVAGPHRLPAHVPTLRSAAVVIVAAGMEGALPSVVGGHVECPVIAVPTSVGYGSSFGGVTALLGMLNSCAANVTVVNIDGGFKAGYLAGIIASRTAAKS
ncbi:MAG: nickel pincer cofactor biosynthesis protein LarB [Planctomycetota bacterium]